MGRATARRAARRRHRRLRSASASGQLAAIQRAAGSKARLRRLAQAPAAVAGGAGEDSFHTLDADAGTQDRGKQEAAGCAIRGLAGRLGCLAQPLPPSPAASRSEVWYFVS